MTVASMRRLSTSSPHKQGGNAFSAHPNQENQELPSLPPIREALSFYYDRPSSSSAKSSAMSLTNHSSNSPLAANESMADVHDKTYTLSSEEDPVRQRQQLHFANTGFDRAVDGDDRFSQVPRGYQGLAYPSLHDQNESPGGSFFDGNASTTSGISSPLSSSVFSSTTDSYAWSGPPARRSAPQDTYSTSATSSGWDRTGDTRRYTDSHYPPNGRPSLPPPPYRMDGHLPPYSSGPPPPYSSSGSYHQHPSRTQSRSMGSIGSFDRAAFPSSTSSAPANGWQYGGPRHESRDFNSAPYHHRAQEYYGSDEYRSRAIPGSHGGATHSNVSSGRLCDSNQRKRRGNLPKETTDKLRAWFTEHLHHPYPSEDEKQDLMHQTGLQMNQISNWFINARRRHLPALINNAKAVSGAMSGVHGSKPSGNDSILGGLTNGVDSIRGSGANGSGPGSMRHKSFYPAAGHMYVSSDRVYGSFDRSLEPRATSIYHGDRRHISPGSDEDY